MLPGTHFKERNEDDEDFRADEEVTNKSEEELDGEGQLRFDLHGVDTHETGEAHLMR